MLQEILSAKGFYDLSVCQDDPVILREICETVVSLGYRTVAINQIIGEPVFTTKKKKKKKEPETDLVEPIPAPISIISLKEHFKEKLKIFNRLTFSFSDQLQAHRIIQSPNTKKYDLLAAIPLTQAAYQLSCLSLNVDIISFDPGNKTCIKQYRKMYNVAIRRGIHFELLYGPALLDHHITRDVISLSHKYHSTGKSKGMILSSNCSLPIHFRGPYDVINVGLIFGLSEEQSKYAISIAPGKVLRRAVCRRLGKIAPILAMHIRGLNGERNETSVSIVTREDVSEEKDTSDAEIELEMAYKRPRQC